MNATPATSLPWSLEGQPEYWRNPYWREYELHAGPLLVARISLTHAHQQGEQNAAYLARAVNAYPRLVEALRSTLGTLEADAQREPDPELRFYAEQHYRSVVDLLREFGEQA